MQRAYSLLAGIPTLDQWSSSVAFPYDHGLLLIAWTQVGSEAEIEGAKRQITAIQEWIGAHSTESAVSTYLSGLTLPVGSALALLYLEEEKIVCGALRAGVTLRRAGKTIALVPMGDALQCVVGTLHPGDVIAFGTGHFCEKYSQLLLKSSDPLGKTRALLLDPQVIASPLLSGGVLQLDEEPPTQFAPLPTTAPVQISTKPVRNIREKSFALRMDGRILKRILLLFAGFALMLLAVVGVSRFVMGSRSARIESATASLTLRAESLKSHTSKPRVEREQQLSDLLRDIEIAKGTYAKDPAIAAKLSTLEQDVRVEYTRVSLRHEISDATIFYDFRLVTADLVPQGIALDQSGKLAVFLDPVKKRLVTLSLEKKQPQTVSIPDSAGTPLSVAVDGGAAYVLGTRGIYTLSLPLNTEGKMLPITKEIWQTPKLLGSFGKNLYVFDEGVRQILRYDTEDSSASPSSWLKNKEGVEITQMTSLAIDGDIWMGTTAGKIYKFSRGDRASFALTGILSPPQSAVFVYTSTGTQKLYVLEPRQERLIVASKTGEFLGAYSGKDFAGARGIVVDEESQTAYMLAGSIVYQIPIAVNRE